MTDVAAGAAAVDDSAEAASQPTAVPSSSPPSAFGSPLMAAASSLTNSAGGSSDVGDSAMDLLSESGDLLVAPLFEKTLHSDVDAARSLSLLRRAWSLDPLLAQVFGPDGGSDNASGSGSTPPGARELSACLSVLVFSAGERIIRAGEEATFAALVLEGDVAAHVAPGVSVPLPAGSWAGEMAYFERGPRSADISVGAGGAVLAVLSYEDLERLNQSAGQADLCHKLTMLLAMASIKKLRKMAPPASSAGASPAIAPAASPSTPVETRSNRSSISGPFHPPLHPSSSPSSSPSGSKKESLFINRLAKQNVALAEIEARQKAELATMKSLVVRREAEAQYARENVKNRLAKIESELREALTRAQDASKKLVAERKKRGEVEAALQRCLAEKAEVALLVSGAESRAAEAIAQSLAAEEARLASESASAASLAALRAELAAARSALEAHLASSMASQSEDVASKLQVELLQSERDSLSSTLGATQAALAQVQNEKGYADFRVRTLTARAESAEDEAQTWKRKSSEYLSAYQGLVGKHRGLLEELGAEKVSFESEHKSFQKLVRLLALRVYVRNWKVRRHLFNIHLLVSEMVVRRWEEQAEEQRRDAGLHWGSRAMVGASAGAPAPGAPAPAHGAAMSPSAAGNGGLVSQSSLLTQLQSATGRTQQLHSILQAQQAAAQGQGLSGNSAATAQASQGGSPSAAARAASLGLAAGTLAPNGNGNLNGGTNPSPSPTASSAALALSLSPSNGGGALAQPYPNGTGGGSHYSYSSGGASDPDASHDTEVDIPPEQMRAEKRRYLAALRNARDPPVSIATLLQSIEDELAELRRPVEGMSHRIRSLRSVLDSFFARNIQLTSKLLNTSRALEVATSSYESLRNSLRARQAAEATINPFSQHVLLESSRAAAAGAGAGAEGSRRTPSLGAAMAFVLDEEKDRPASSSGAGGGGGGGAMGVGAGAGIPSALAGALSARGAPPSTAPSAGGGGGSSTARRPSSSSGDIDWAALAVEKSSGYGVTRPMVRRESRIAPGLGPKAPAGPGARRPSAMGAANSRSQSVPFVPHPPSASPPPSSSPPPPHFSLPRV